MYYLSHQGIWYSSGLMPNFKFAYRIWGLCCYVHTSFHLRVRRRYRWKSASFIASQQTNHCWPAEQLANFSRTANLNAFETGTHQSFFKTSDLLAWPPAEDFRLITAVKRAKKKPARPVVPTSRVSPPIRTGMRVRNFSL